MPTKFDSAPWCNYIFAFRKIDQNHIIKIINLGINHNIVMEILIAQYNDGKKKLYLQSSYLWGSSYFQLSKKTSFYKVWNIKRYSNMK